MKIDLNGVAKGAKHAALPPMSVSYRTGEVTLARTETEQRPTVLGLIASGRMRPDAGTVTIDGASDYAAMRKQIALIDAPDVCEPASDVTVAGITAEELMFAGRPSHPIAVGRALAALGLGDYARSSIGTVPPAVRLRLLTELAILREGIRGLVITSPDRHGGDPIQWWAIARDLAARDLAVLVVAGDASAAAIGASGLIERMAATADAHRAEPQTFDEDPGLDDTDAPLSISSTGSPSTSSGTENPGGPSTGSGTEEEDA